MIRFNKEEINKKYSRAWTFCNDNSQSKMFRARFIEQFGGKFVKKSRYFEWEEPPVDKKRKYVLQDINGVVYIIENLTEFCNKNSVKREKIYEVIGGQRKSYKGFKYITTIQPPNYK